MPRALRRLPVPTNRNCPAPLQSTPNSERPSPRSSPTAPNRTTTMPRSPGASRPQCTMAGWSATGEHVVADRGRHDQDCVCPDPQHVLQHGPSGSRSESPRRVASSSGLTHACSTRDRARASSESSGASGEGSSVRDVPARRVGGVARRQDALLTRWQSAGTSPGRFGKAVEEPSHRQGQRSEQDEREVPRHDDRRPSGDEQPGAGPDLFIGQNEFEHHPLRGGGEPVAGQ